MRDDGRTNGSVGGDILRVGSFESMQGRASSLGSGIDEVMHCCQEDTLLSIKVFELTKMHAVI